MLSIDWTQHAVGHGGFHTGHMHCENGSDYSWVFDCGSRRTNKFDDFLLAWTEHNQAPIDWLFISHFDTDHVSGLNTLLARTVVRDVMVPYVNEHELAYVLLYEIGRGSANRAFIELIADPAAFFLSRGVNRVTFLRGRLPDSESGEGDFHPVGPSDDQGWLTKLRPQPISLKTSSQNTKTPPSSASVQMIDGGMCEMNVIRGSMGLRLKPYCAPIERRQQRALIKTLKAQVGFKSRIATRSGLGQLAFVIANYARTRQGRADLRSTFKKYAGSPNRSSMSLLSIPYMQDVRRSHWNIVRPFTHQFGKGEVGWMNTGDAELLAADDLADWQRSYRGDLDKVQVLALPHHGSDKNSNAKLQQLCPNAVLAAHVKSNAIKHPGAGVVHAAGNRLVRVTEQPWSQVRMTFHAG